MIYTYISGNLWYDYCKNVILTINWFFVVVFRTHVRFNCHEVNLK